MKYNPFEFTLRAFGQFRVYIAAFLAAACCGTAQAQIQTAGTQYVNIDATTLSASQIHDITNNGTLGGFFEGTNAVLVTNLTLGGPNALFFQSAVTNLMVLLNGIGGALIPTHGPVFTAEVPFGPAQMFYRVGYLH